MALTGETLIDVSNQSKNRGDIAESVILIRGDRIISVEKTDEIPIPDDAEIIDNHGSWVQSGLIDGFATLNNQSHADAYLSMGIIGV